MNALLDLPDRPSLDCGDACPSPQALSSGAKRLHRVAAEGDSPTSAARLPMLSPWHLKTKCYNRANGTDCPDVAGFKAYLKNTADLTLNLALYDMQEMKKVEYSMPYTHRWHEKYRNRTLAKFYKFNQWWEEEGRPPLTLLTLTTYQDSRYAEDHHGSRVSIKEGFEILKDSWKKLRMMLRNRILCRRFDYLWAMEPHLSRDTGYPHMHVVIVGELTDVEKEAVKRLWCQVYNAGSYDHGANFSDSCLDAKKDIRNAGFYLFKYLGKGFCIDPDQMTPGELRFNAVLWEKGYRQWGASRNISHAMKLDKTDADRFRFLSIGVSMPGYDTVFREATKADKEAIQHEAMDKICWASKYNLDLGDDDMSKKQDFEKVDKLDGFLDQFGICLTEHNQINIESIDEFDVVVKCGKCGRIYGFSRDLWDKIGIKSRD